MPKQQIIIATRESPLALKQAYWVKDRLQAIHPTLTVELLGITTTGDIKLSTSLAAMGGKGLFVKQLEEALLDGRADIAVHSMKDIPTDLLAGLCLPVICERENPFDVFISKQFSSIADLPEKAIVGTASVRRQSQLKILRPDLIITLLRGNVNTRLARLEAGDFAAIILARAGLNRLGLPELGLTLTPEQMLPAVGQGALGIECRKNDPDVSALIAPLNHLPTQRCVSAERALSKRLGGGCSVPIGAYAEMRQEQLFLRGLVASADGQIVLRAEGTGSLVQAEQLGTAVAEDLLRLGAERILSCG